MQGGIHGTFRTGKRNSTDDVTNSPIKYEVTVCKKIISCMPQ